ncbi:leucine-rich repeat protein [Muricauda sp. SCSIO 64092]|uniref:leucine-rich repeat protein n=1 Tax=Allomuricauda sp. SCSIO 64092 TaxID=2908842 RepID=UPI001FF33F0D|nr:leucine-rich repeat protein [Muricauda sp. SCSIO 64092]UOY07084.1 leucine-rich repeat protein [Muricauda sp. SCSIO 64092]
MERRLRCILSAILMALAGLNGYGQNIFDVEGYWYEITSSTSTPPQVEITGYDEVNFGTEVTIPVTVNHNGTDHDVTAIRKHAFDNKQLERVTFTDTPGTPSKLTSIGEGAFSRNQLTEVAIPNSVTSIGEWAFIHNKLDRVTFTNTPVTPNKVTSIGEGAFWGNQLTEVAIPYGVTDIGDIAFENNQLDSVTFINFPGTTLGSVTSIGAQAFAGNQLTKVVIPNSVTSIGYFAFKNNKLDSVTFTDTPVTPSKVTSIRFGAFQDNQLTKVVIPNSVTSIGNFAFWNNQLTEVAIPGSVTRIGDGAFLDNQLTEVAIPGSVTSIGNGAFLHNHLTEVTMEADDPPALHTDAFQNPGRDQIDLIVPAGRRQAYLDDGRWTGFKSITIKTFADGGIRYGIISPTEVEVTGYTGTATEVAIPPTANDDIRTFDVTAIGNRAFLGKGLTSVTMPDGLTRIGDNAFQDNQLTSVTMPDGVTSIGHSAFRDNQLTSMTIPDGAISIGHSAFQDNQLTEVAIPDGVTDIGDNAFQNNQLTEVAIPDGVTDIGHSAFQNNRLTSVAVPDGVTRIGHSTFHNNRLTHVAIPDGVTEIGDNTFQNNDLSSVVIPNSVGNIGRSAFGDNPYLGMMTVEADDPPALDADAFGGLYDNDTNLRGQIHLIVPPGRVQAYLDNGWRGFKSISDGSDLPLPTIGAPQSVGGLGPFTVDISFDGEVTGLGLDDIEVAHATVSSLSGSGSTYTATLEPTSLCDGVPITVDVPVNVAESTATGFPNQAAAQVIVAVVDAIAPTIACPADVVADAADNGTGDCTATVALGSPVAEDNCSVASVVAQVNGTEVDPDTYAFGIGTTTVTWMVSDGSGNTASCQQTVTVGEDLDNLVAMAKDITVQLDADGTASISPDMVDNGSNYGCGSIPELSLDRDTFTCGDVGVPITVVLTAAHSTNTATATALVTVVENLDNLVASAKDITVQLDADGTASISPDMVDNGSNYGCNNTPELSLDITTFDCDDVGTPVTVVLTAAQGSETATATAKVTVEANGNCELGPLTDFNRGFSPNGDGIGDTLVIEGLEHYRNNVVRIYDLGQRLLFSAHYGGPGDAWDGTDERGLVPVGSYVCVIDYNEPELGHEAKMIYVNY